MLPIYPADGWAMQIRIEHGSQSPDADTLALHSRVARQMESSGNLLARIKSQLGDGNEASLGSAAWEAQFELKKIQAESQIIAKRLENPAFTAPERARLTFRLDELEVATTEQTQRLSQLEQLG